MIRNRTKFETWLPAAFDGEFQWDFLAPCFKDTKIMPMDFDSVVEKNGHFLIFETKEEGKEIEKGQSITLTNMWKKDTTIVHVAGKTPETISGFSVYGEWESPKAGNVGDRGINEGDAFDLIFSVRRWFCWSLGTEMPSREEWDRELWVWDYGRKTA